MSHRPLWNVVGLLVAAAVALWIGSLRGGGAAQSALAVLALAMIAAAVATGGLPRRLLGAVVAAVGVLTAVAASGGAFLPAILGAAAGLFLLTAGVLLATLGHRMPRMGSRYRSRPSTSERTMWDELDAGRDPTG
jgi:Tryptophan-associated transmembrane protein (Trp_oprn_chp)